MTLVLPRTLMPDAGYPLALSFHGSGGSSHDVIDNGPTLVPGGPMQAGTGPGYILASHGIASAGSAMPVNPERLPGAAETAYLNFQNLPAMRDTFRQGIVEQRLFLDALLKLQIEPSLFASCTGAALPAAYTNLIAAVELAAARCRGSCRGSSVPRPGIIQDFSHRGTRVASAGMMFDVLFDEVPGDPVPEYGGNPRWTGVAANFVESVDGVVALAEAAGESGGVVSGGSRADKFLMGMLRSCADAVLIGAGTFRASPRDLWFADSIFPEAASVYSRVGRLRPQLYVVSGSAQIDASAPALQQGGIVLAGRMTPQQILDRIRADGHQRILCEGGPGLFTELAAANLIGELFLTVSPRLFGRYAGDLRKAITDSHDLHGRELTLLSLRRSSSHLLLRYALK